MYIPKQDYEVKTKAVRHKWSDVKTVGLPMNSPLKLEINRNYVRKTHGISASDYSIEINNSRLE